MLNEPVPGEAPAAGGGGGGGQAGGVAPTAAGGGGPMSEAGYIQVTPDEKQAIERVSAMSFDVSGILCDYKLLCGNTAHCDAVLHPRH